ncbi:hypothetical protein ACHAPJ_009195 [Fusarium lateritium]
MANPSNESTTKVKAIQETQDIYSQALKCKTLFITYTSSPRIFVKEVTECQRRFLTWASFLGVFAKESVCLDRRLQYDPEIKELVLSMIWVLDRNLQRGIALHETLETTGSEKVEQDAAMYGIHGAVSRLQRLAMTIREAPKNDEVEEVKRVRNFVSKRNPDGFSEVMTAMVQFLFPDIEKTFQSQLIDSITYRRHRLLWRRRHSQKLRHERQDKDADQAEVETRNIPSRHSQAKIRSEGKKAGFRHPGPETVFSSTLPSQQLPKRSINKNLSRVQKDHQNQQEARSARSSNPPPRAIYPDRPQVSVDVPKVICKYCLEEVDMPPEATDQERDVIWRNHLNEDLRPYTCISEECRNFPTSFSTVKEWKTHLCDKHDPNWTRYIYRIKWHCPYCPKEEVYFWTQELLARHLTEDGAGKHPAHLDKLELARVTARGKTGIPRDETECPLCGLPPWQNPGVSDPNSRPATQESNDVYQHIGSHLQHLALLSLSWWEDDVGEQHSGLDDAASSDEAIGFNSEKENIPDVADGSLEPVYFDESTLEKLKSTLVQHEMSFQANNGNLVTAQTLLRQTFQAGFGEQPWKQLAKIRSQLESGLVTDELVDWLHNHRQHIYDRTNDLDPRKKRIQETIGGQVEVPYLLKSQDAYLKYMRYDKLRAQLRKAHKAVEKNWNNVSTGPSLKEKIIQNFVTGISKAKDPAFLPEGILHHLVTPEAVARELQYLNPYSQGDLDIFNSILNDSKKIFGILCYLDFAGIGLTSIVERLLSSGISDTALPASEAIIHSWSHLFEAGSPRVAILWESHTSTVFYEAQWRFFAPVFRKSTDRYLFDKSHILPVTFTYSDVTDVFSRRVRQATIPSSHINSFLPSLGSHLATSDIASRNILVREIKKLKANASQERPSDVEKYMLETKALEALSQLHHSNMMECFAVLDGMSTIYFLFDHDGCSGTLNGLWAASASHRNLSMAWIEQAVSQMYGIADALHIMHQSGYCHGGLNPGNLHVFQDDRNGFLYTVKLSAMDITRDVPFPSDPLSSDRHIGYLGIAYDSPETLKGADRSFSNDMWSFARIILEWIICLLYSYHDLTGFRDLTNTDSDSTLTDGFVIHTFDGFRLHSVVTAWMDHMAKDPACSRDDGWATSTNKRLAVSTDSKFHFPRRPPRASSSELRRTLHNIVTKVTDVRFLLAEDDQHTVYGPPLLELASEEEEDSSSVHSNIAHEAGSKPTESRGSFGNNEEIPEDNENLGGSWWDWLDWWTITRVYRLIMS